MAHQIIKLMPEDEWNVVSNKRGMPGTHRFMQNSSSEELLQSTINGMMTKNHNSSRHQSGSSRRRGFSWGEASGAAASKDGGQPKLEHYSVDNIDLTSYKALPTKREDILLDACQLAYYNHQPIVFSPDLVYGYLAKGIAAHISKYPEEMRKLYVSHDGKKELFYRNDSFVRGSKENDWSLMFKNFADQLKGETKENSVVQNDLMFSTSTTMTEAHRHVLAMESMKSYFEYTMVCGCGTACVILEGTADDWHLLKEKVTAQLQEINEYCDTNRKAKSANLKWWSPLVELMLDNFVTTYENQESGQQLSEELKLWWNAIYKYNAAGGSGMGGPSFITGWVNIFFPYIDGSGSLDARNPWVSHWAPIVPDTHIFYNKLKDVSTEKNEDMNYGPFGPGRAPEKHPDEIRINPDSYSSYVASVPFKWMYYGDKFDMKALIGYSILAQVAVAGGEYPVGTLKMFPAWVIYYEHDPKK